MQQTLHNELCGNYESMPDEQLMIHTSEGHKDAFTTLIRRYQQAMLNFFSKMGVYSDSEDLTQQTFVKLFNYRDRYKPRAKFKTFLYLIARRIYLDHIRKENRERTGKKAYTQDISIEQTTGTASKSLKADAVEALHKLPEDMKSVVVLNIYNGMKYSEIAEILEIPVGTVKTRMFYAIRKLRENVKNRNDNSN